MRTVLAIPVPAQHSVISLAVWDLFFRKTLERLKDVLNPNLRRDLALDATIRQLGPRPKTPKAEAEPAGVKTVSYGSPGEYRTGMGSPHGQDGWRDRHIARRQMAEDRMEELCTRCEEAVVCE